MILKKLSPRILMAVGLLLLASGLAVRAVFPDLVHGDAADFVVGLMIGLGLALEVGGFWKLRKATRAS